MSPELLADLQALADKHKVELVGTAKPVVLGDVYDIKPNN